MYPRSNFRRFNVAYARALGYLAGVVSLAGSALYFRSKSIEAAEIAAEKLANEILDAKGTYYVGYLVKAFSKNPKTIRVFKFVGDFPVILPKLDGKPYEAFIYAGTKNDLHDPEAKKQIANKNYTKCSWEDNPLTREKVIITGRTDCYKACQDFKVHLIRDIIMHKYLKGERFNETEALSDIPVYKIAKNTFEKVGELAELPEEYDETIKVTDFTVCPFVGFEKTRLSHGSYYQDIVAIILGVNDTGNCLPLYEWRRLNR